jgi:hypothetical protein
MSMFFERCQISRRSLVFVQECRIFITTTKKAQKYYDLSVFELQLSLQQ